MGGRARDTRLGPRAAFSDSEVLTVSIVAALVGLDAETHCTQAVLAACGYDADPTLVYNFRQLQVALKAPWPSRCSSIRQAEYTVDDEIGSIAGNDT